MKTEASNTIIAEYDGIKPSGFIRGDDLDPKYKKGEFVQTGWGGLHKSELKYDSSMDWLYPVYLKLRKELKDLEDYLMGTSDPGFNSLTSYNRRSAIEVALIHGDIAELHAEIVKGINFINEQKK